LNGTRSRGANRGTGSFRFSDLFFGPPCANAGGFTDEEAKNDDTGDDHQIR